MVHVHLLLRTFSVVSRGSGEIGGKCFRRWGELNVRASRSNTDFADPKPPPLPFPSLEHSCPLPRYMNSCVGVRQFSQKTANDYWRWLAPGG